MAAANPHPCTNIRDLFPSQAGAAAALKRRERSSMTESSEIDIERLARLMAAFENGDVPHPSNPFDVNDPLAFAESKPSQIATAFAELAKSDTPWVRDGENAMTQGDHQTALVVAGLFQGMWIGWEYAQRDVYPEES